MREVMLEEHDWLTEDAKKKYLCHIKGSIISNDLFLQYGHMHMCKRVKRNKLILLS